MIWWFIFGALAGAFGFWMGWTAYAAMLQRTWWIPWPFK
jgi:hypothetical protein